MIRGQTISRRYVAWPGLPQVREKKILGKVREIYFESGKIDILKKSQGKLK